MARSDHPTPRTISLEPRYDRALSLKARSPPWRGRQAFSSSSDTGPVIALMNLRDQGRIRGAQRVLVNRGRACGGRLAAGAAGAHIRHGGHRGGRTGQTRDAARPRHRLHTPGLRRAWRALRHRVASPILAGEASTGAPFHFRADRPRPVHAGHRVLGDLGQMLPLMAASPSSSNFRAFAPCCRASTTGPRSLNCSAALRSGRSSMSG